MRRVILVWFELLVVLNIAEPKNLGTLPWSELICFRLTLLRFSIEILNSNCLSVCWTLAAFLQGVPCTVVEHAMLGDKVLLPVLLTYRFCAYETVLRLTLWSLLYLLLGLIVSAFFFLCDRLSFSSSNPLTSKPVFFFESLDLPVSLSYHMPAQVALTTLHFKCI